MIQNRKLTRNMISCIFQLNCKANAANVKWNSVFIWLIRRESVENPHQTVPVETLYWMDRFPHTEQKKSSYPPQVKLENAKSSVDLQGPYPFNNYLWVCSLLAWNDGGHFSRSHQGRFNPALVVSGMGSQHWMLLIADQRSWLIVKWSAWTLILRILWINVTVMSTVTLGIPTALSQP